MLVSCDLHYPTKTAFGMTEGEAKDERRGADVASSVCYERSTGVRGMGATAG